MNRRAFLACVPTVALAGCFYRLGLAERVVVLEKTIEGVEVDLETGERRTVTLLTRRDGPEGPTYETVHDDLEGTVSDDEPLAFEGDLRQDLESTYPEIRLRARVCDSAPLEDPDAASGCRSVSIVSEDFDEVRVGDVIDVRESDDGIGLLEVHKRREDR
ncbi:hypothetical protein [Natronosalvus rutilus]|uniref:Uncharacterized protein n=1 Tax=Natronosalvus rutilus TaxID=2953753 RepID=A0A9E7SX76_9EURY|nr:hypothetical protein [Natronosalvus rutilus]UTF53878.1 hypothetical protein NGM29_00925 [Natronosalvus rutilus]